MTSLDRLPHLARLAETHATPPHALGLVATARADRERGDVVGIFHDDWSDVMGDTPEMIWAMADVWTCADVMEEATPAGAVEYVRKDMFDALTAERDALRAEVERLTVALNAAWETTSGIAEHILETRNTTVNVKGIFADCQRATQAIQKTFAQIAALKGGDA